MFVVQNQIPGGADLQPRAEVAADEHGANGVRRTARRDEELAQRRAEFDLVHARHFHRTRQGDERGSRLARRAGFAEPLGAVACDQRKVGERLEILDERRAARDAALERTRRDERRLCRTAVEKSYERTLLSG